MEKAGNSKSAAAVAVDAEAADAGSGAGVSFGACKGFTYFTAYLNILCSYVHMIHPFSDSYCTSAFSLNTMGSFISKMLRTNCLRLGGGWRHIAVLLRKRRHKREPCNDYFPFLLLLKSKLLFLLNPSPGLARA